MQVPIFPESEPIESFTTEKVMSLINDCIDYKFKLSTEDVVSVYEIVSIASYPYFKDIITPK